MSDLLPNGNGRWNKWGAVAGVGVFLLVLCGAGLTFIVQNNSTANMVAQQGIELGDMRRRVDALSAEASTQRVRLAEYSTKLTEIETQFCSADAVRNLSHAADLRIVSMLWKKVFDITYPTDNAFYPTICHGGMQQGETGR